MSIIESLKESDESLAKSDSYKQLQKLLSKLDARPLSKEEYHLQMISFIKGCAGKGLSTEEIEKILDPAKD